VPLFAAHFWHEHYGKVAAAWALAFLVPFSLAFGVTETSHHVAHAILLEYVPFLVILFALFTIAGGICLRGSFAGTPALNTGILALGAALASLMGTTGAAMLLIRPLLTANEMRQHRAHAIVFFIILVGNVGGALSPLGDPPLFIGFLKGVDSGPRANWRSRPRCWSACCWRSSGSSTSGSTARNRSCSLRHQTDRASPSRARSIFC
jgi:Na+/H+ antiporter NhaD/arsenite permease-like protein